MDITDTETMAAVVAAETMVSEEETMTMDLISDNGMVSSVSSIHCSTRNTSKYYQQLIGESFS